MCTLEAVQAKEALMIALACTNLELCKKYSNPDVIVLE